MYGQFFPINFKIVLICYKYDPYTVYSILYSKLDQIFCKSAPSYSNSNHNYNNSAPELVLASDWWQVLSVRWQNDARHTVNCVYNYIVLCTMWTVCIASNTFDIMYSCVLLTLHCTMYCEQRVSSNYTGNVYCTVYSRWWRVYNMKCKYDRFTV